MCFVLPEATLRVPRENAIVVSKAGVEISAKRRDVLVCLTWTAPDVVHVTVRRRHVIVIQDGLGGDAMSQLVLEPQCAAIMVRVRALQPYHSVPVTKVGWAGLVKPNVNMAPHSKQLMDPSFASVMTASVVYRATWSVLVVETVQITPVTADLKGGVVPRVTQKAVQVGDQTAPVMVHVLLL